MHHWKSLVFFLALVFAAAAIGSTAVPDAWFASLMKPSFNPPNWIFAPVWTMLYVFMAIAAWRVYRVVGARAAVFLWTAQLLCNAIWSLLFFRLHRIDLALADIFLLLALIVATIIAFFRYDRGAGILLLPYGGWVAFATLLNFSFWQLNPQ